MDVLKLYRNVFAFLTLSLSIFICVSVNYLVKTKSLHPATDHHIWTKEPDPTRVLVVTYMRSGSTLIGDVLQHYDNSAYAFEPLRYFAEDIKNKSKITFLNGTRRLYSKKDHSLIKAEMLYRWFTCDWQNINIMDLTSGMLIYSYAFKGYYFCIRKRMRTNGSLLHQRRNYINDCLELIKKPCNTRKVLIIKTIRLEMTSVELLLKWLPGLKVIHLLRDPRGKLSSELKKDQKGWSTIASKASSHCNQMLSDIKITHRLHKKYSKNIRILQYEGFSNEPILKTRKIFNFLNMKFTYRVFYYVKVHTLKQNVSEYCYWCAKRTNAKLASSKWRLLIQLKHARQIDKSCWKLYRTVGFQPMKDTTHLRNLSIPSQVELLKYMSL